MSRYGNHITQLLGIESPTDICFGDVQNHQKRTSILSPVIYGSNHNAGILINDSVIIINISDISDTLPTPV